MQIQNSRHHSGSMQEYKSVSYHGIIKEGMKMYNNQLVEERNLLDIWHNFHLGFNWSLRDDWIIAVFLDFI